MAMYGISIVIAIVAWDTSANTAKTGDSANITLKWLKDGTNTTTTNACSEVDATNSPGLYKVTLTATEAQALVGVLSGKSSTANVSIIPITFTFDQIPNAVPGAAGGLFIAGTNAATMITTALTTTFTGNVTGTVASVVGAVGSVTGLTAANLDVAVSSRGTSNYAGGAVASVTGSVGSVVGLTASNLDTTISSRAAEPQGIKKNTARTITVPIFDSTDHLTPKSGLTVTGTRSIDGAAFGALANAITEITGTGYYVVAFSAADLNGDEIAVKLSPSAGGDVRTFTIVTVT